MDSSRNNVSDFNKNRKYKFSTASTKIDFSLLSHVYNQAKVGIIASLFCATLVFIGMYKPEPDPRLYIWYIIFVVISIFRFTAVNWYMASAEPEKHVRFWSNLYILSSLLGGISWGLVSILVFPWVTQLQQTLIILILAGITAGAVPLISAILPAAFAFLMMSIFPLFCTLLFTQSYYIFNVALGIYMLYLIVISRNTYKLLVNSISLQFENHALLSNLSHAKSQLELINQKLEQAASHDPLTNVANRNLFIDNFNDAIQRAKNNKRILGLLFIDLDTFKNVNDIHGHHVGDQLLLVLVDRIEQIIEDTDAISRLGGDEFTIILENIATPNEIATVAEKLRVTLAQPVTVNMIDLKVSASIGISIYPIDGDDADKLLNVADKAMYLVKEKGGNNFRFNDTLLVDK